MTDLHRILAYASLAVAAVGLLWSLWLVAGRRPSGRGYIVTVALGVVATMLAGMLGALLQGMRRAPDDGLHIVYGLAAVVAPGIALLIAYGRPARTQALVMTAGWLVELGLILRLFQTG